MLRDSASSLTVEFDLSCLAPVADRYYRQARRWSAFGTVLTLAGGVLALIILFGLRVPENTPAPAFAAGQTIFSISLIVLFLWTGLMAVFREASPKPIKMRIDEGGVELTYASGKFVSYKWSESGRIALLLDLRSKADYPIELAFAFDVKSGPLLTVAGSSQTTGPVPIPEAAFREILTRARAAGANVDPGYWEGTPLALQTGNPTRYRIRPLKGILKNYT